MKAPLSIEYDEAPKPCISIVDADGRMIVEDMGPEGTYSDAVRLVRAFNRCAQSIDDAPDVPETNRKALI